MSKLEIYALVKHYGKHEALHGLSLDVSGNEFVVFVGPSGCGKSTFLRTIAGLEDITSGVISIDGDPINELEPDQRGVAMVFQNYALYPHMSVAQNMGFALRMAGVPKDKIKQKVDAAAKVLKLEPYLERRPADLSGGQRQRVAIGRAIVRDPKVFLFDEPLSNLDADLRAHMRLEVIKLHRQQKAISIYVTHDQVEAMTMADKIVVMHDGHIEQIGSPLELYNEPINQFVAGFLGTPKMNFLPAMVKATEGDKLAVSVLGANVEAQLKPGHNLSLNIGDKLTVGVRANGWVQDANGIKGALVHAEQLGSETVMFVELPQDNQVTLVRPGQHQFETSETLSISPNPSKLYLFDAHGNSLPVQRVYGASQ